MNNIKESFKNVLQSMTSIKMIMWFRLLFGIYFKISDSKFICWLLRVYCLCSSIAFTIGFYVGHNSRFSYIDFFGCFEYIFNVLSSLVTADGYFLKFCNAISTADTIMNYKRVALVSNNINIIIFLVVVTRLGLGILHHLASPMSTLKFVCPFIMFTSVNTYFVTVIIIFSLLHTRMKMLRKFMERNSIPVNILGEDQVANSIRRLRKGLFTYRYLLDSLYSINYQLQYLLVSTLTFNIPLIIYFSYSALRTYLKMDALIFTVNLLEAIQALFLVTSPGIITELIDNEVAKIETTLLRQLLMCSDPSLHYELETALQYVRWRPFKYMICGAVPLNARLPLNMAALCFTYVIISVQFRQLH